MKRIDSFNARANANGAGKSGFSDNADLPGQDATYLTPDWLNHIQEELANLLEKNGIGLDPNSRQQLFELLATKTDLASRFATINSSLAALIDALAANAADDASQQDLAIALNNFYNSFNPRLVNVENTLQTIFPTISQAVFTQRSVSANGYNFSNVNDLSNLFYVYRQRQDWNFGQFHMPKARGQEDNVFVCAPNVKMSMYEPQDTSWASNVGAHRWGFVNQSFVGNVCIIVTTESDRGDDNTRLVHRRNGAILVDTQRTSGWLVELINLQVGDIVEAYCEARGNGDTYVLLYIDQIFSQSFIP